VWEFFEQSVFKNIFFHVIDGDAPLVRMGHHINQPATDLLIDAIQLIKGLLADVPASQSEFQP
jgi:hypothetical protein